MNEERKQLFYEGDHIICGTKDGKRYIGRIIAINRGQENEGTEPDDALYLNISPNKRGYSGEMIKIADITCMYRFPADDVIGYPATNENLDKDNFINMIAALGHDKEKAETIYNCMKELISLYNIPLSRVLACAIQETGLSTERKDEKREEELINISNKFLTAMIEVLQAVTNSIKKVQIPYIDS